MKRYLSAFVSIMLCLSVLPLRSGAAENADFSSDNFDDAADISVMASDDTVTEFKNLIENGDMSNTLDLSMWSDSNSFKSIRYADCDGESAMRWEVQWTNAAFAQYLTGNARKEKYNFIGGHKYFVSARVKTAAENNMVWSIWYATETDSNTYHSLTWKTIPADEWTYVRSTFTIPENVIPDKGYAVRLVAQKYPNVVYVDDFELYDCTAAPGGTPQIVSVTPEDGTEELPRGTLNMEIAFDKPMLPTTFTNSNITSSAGSISDIRLSADKQTCMLTIDDLDVNQTCTVSLSNKLQSMAGQSMEAASFTFKTKQVNTKTPEIVNMSPVDGEVVPIKKTSMEIHFDVPMNDPNNAETIISEPEGLIEKIEWSDDAPESIRLFFNEELFAPGRSFKIIVTPELTSQAGTPLDEALIVSFNVVTREEAAEMFKKAVSDTSEDAEANLLEFMRSYYSDLQPDDELCGATVLGDDVLAGLYVKALLEEGADSSASAGEIADMVLEYAMLTAANYGGDEDVIKSLLEGAVFDDESSGLKATYDSLSKSDKSKIYQEIINHTQPFASADAFADFSEERIVFAAFASSNGWGRVSEIFENNTGYFSAETNALADKVNKSGSKAEIYNRLQGLNPTSESSIYSALLAAYNTVSTASTRSKGGSGGGSKAGAVITGPMSEDALPKADEGKAAAIFTDIDGVQWAKEAIEHLCALGVINGKGAGKFHPDDAVTREEFVKMLVVAANIPMTDKKVRFSDVSEDDWFYPYVTAAVQSKLVVGMDSSRFGTGENISRQDIAVICRRLLEINIEDFGENDGEAEEKTELADMDSVSDYALEAVESLTSLKIISGDENMCFNPHKSATRAETAVLLRRLTEAVNRDGR